jgi:hypothetical protein
MINNHSSLNLDDFTVSFWFSTTVTSIQTAIKQTYYPNAQNEKFTAIFSRDVPNRVEFLVKYNLCSSSGWQYNTDTLNVFDGQFHHFVGIASGNTILVYIDGEFSNSFTAPFPISAPCYWGDIQIGRGWASHPDYFQGKLDDFGIWNRALTEVELSNLFTQTSIGINDVSQDIKISIYPNPTAGILNINADKSLLGTDFYIHDLTGRLIFNGEINSDIFDIDVDGFSEGVYLFSYGKDSRQVIKIVKQ